MPEGCAVTGVGLREKSTNLNKLVLYYQLINRGESTNNGSALEAKVYSIHRGGDTGMEAEYRPSDNNTKVIQGIKVGGDGSEKVVVLKLLHADFALPITLLL